MVVERLYPEVIARKEQSPLVLIPYGEGEHPAQMFHHALPIFAPRVQQHLGVRVRAEQMSLRPQALSKLAIIVDFPVEDDPQPAVSCRHRLSGVFGEIDNGQPAMAQTDLAVLRDPSAGTVGSAQQHVVPGAQQLVPVDGRALVGINCCQSAHGKSAISTPLHHLDCDWLADLVRFLIDSLPCRVTRISTTDDSPEAPARMASFLISAASKC